MPGILQVTETSVRSRLFAYALAAEFLGTTIFSLFGSSTTLAGTTNSSLNNAVGNGLTLTVIVFITANISGAHINPAVTVAAWIAGYISLLKACLYIVCQIAGGIMGSLLLVALVKPAVAIGSSATPSGCFANSGITAGQVAGWEAIMTAVLVFTVFAVAISEPDFGNVAPVGIGLALLVCVQAAGKYTGGALNPARALGPSIVFGCSWNVTWVYVLAELAGAIFAGLCNIPLYGRGKHFMKAASELAPAEPEELPSHNSGSKAARPSKKSKATTQELPNRVDVLHTTHDNLLNTGDREPV